MSRTTRGKLTKSQDLARIQAKMKRGGSLKDASNISKRISAGLEDLKNLDFKDSTPTNLVRLTATLADSLNSSLEQRLLMDGVSKEDHQQYLDLMNGTLTMLREGFVSILEETHSVSQDLSMGALSNMGVLRGQLKEHIKTVDSVLSPVIEPIFEDFKKWLKKDYSNELSRALLGSLEKIKPGDVSALYLGGQSPKELISLQESLVELKEMMQRSKNIPTQWIAGVDSVLGDTKASMDAKLKELNESDPVFRALKAKQEAATTRLEALYKSEQQELDKINARRKSALGRIGAAVRFQSPREMSLNELQERKSGSALSRATGGVQDLGILGSLLGKISVNEGSLADRMMGDYLKRNPNQREEAEKEAEEFSRKLEERMEKNRTQVEIKDSVITLERRQEFQTNKLDGLEDQISRLGSTADQILRKLMALDGQQPLQEDSNAPNPYDDLFGNNGGPDIDMDNGVDREGRRRRNGGRRTPRNARGGRLPRMASKFNKLGGLKTAGIIGGTLIAAGGAYQYATAESSSERTDAVGETGGAIAGMVVGGKAGAAIGGTVGAFFGGIGAVPGAAIGGLIGGGIGAAAGSSVGKWVSSLFKDPQDEIPDEIKSKGPDAELAYIDSILSPAILNSPEMDEEKKQNAMKQLIEYSKGLDRNKSPTDFVWGYSDRRILTEMEESGLIPNITELKKRYRTLTPEDYRAILDMSPKGSAVLKRNPEAVLGERNIPKPGEVSLPLVFPISSQSDELSNRIQNASGSLAYYQSGGASSSPYSMMQSAYSNSTQAVQTAMGLSPVSVNSGLVRKIDNGDGTSQVREGGSRAWRNNNPGNLRFGDFAKRKGAIGADAQGFAIFKDRASGESAQRDLLKGTYGDNSISQMMERYAPRSENDTDGYIKMVAKATGLSPDARISDMNEEQFSSLVAAMQKKEGWKEGSVSSVASGSSSEKAMEFAKTSANNPLIGSFNDQIKAQTEKAISKGVGYQFGSKNLDSGAIDCSGWIAAINKNVMQQFNSQSDTPIFDLKDQKLFETNAAGIIDNVAKKTGFMLEGGDVQAANLRAGMLIGENNGTGRGTNRGIDHITQVVQGPDGQMMVSQSQGGKGVTMTPLDQYLAAKNKRGSSLYAVDPMKLADPGAMKQDPLLALNAKIDQVLATSSKGGQGSSDSQAPFWDRKDMMDSAVESLKAQEFLAGDTLRVV